MPTYLNFLTPKILKMCDPILVTLIKMQPHNSQSSDTYIHTCLLFGVLCNKSYINHFQITKITKPLFQSNSKCKATDMKMIFILMQIKLIFTRRVLHLALFWKWEVLELRNRPFFIEHRLECCRVTFNYITIRLCFQNCWKSQTCALRKNWMDPKALKSRVPSSWFLGKKMWFSSHPGAKVMCQGPPGVARALPSVLLDCIFYSHSISCSLFATV